MTIRLKADVSSVAGRILELACKVTGRPVLAAIDGRCGSGKTTLAGVLREMSGAAVVHMDDFFLRAGQRTPERFREPGGNADRERVLEEVLIPLRERRPVIYRPYDAHRNLMLEPVRLEPAPLVVIEGSYCCHPALWEYYDLRVFADVQPQEQLRRIEARNGPGRLRDFKERWIPLEEAYFSAFSPEEKCDLCIELTSS